ncbi:MAG TPA: hypothetical protein VHA37_03795 [Candidatus Saccharimonadales bacterium]|nr:hypothetical protein [Candidatus Saccharimonadales bacterium]
MEQNESGYEHTGSSSPDIGGWESLAYLDFTPAVSEASSVAEEPRRTSDVYLYPDEHSHEDAGDTWAGQPNTL